MSRFATLIGLLRGNRKNNSKSNSWNTATSTRRLRLELLEERQLLAVTTGTESTFLPAPTGSELIVTTLADTVDDTDGLLSLREAISSASNGDTITFDVSLAGGTITLSGTQLSIDIAISIDASALEGGITIDGNQQSRVFYITGGTNNSPVELVNLTIQNGMVTDYDGGGGICNKGRLTLTNCTVTGNYDAEYSGGGICNFGTLTLTNCTVTGNTAEYIGGGVYNNGTLTLTNCTVTENTTGDGGGIYNDSGRLMLTNCTVTGNTAKYNGGGIYINEGTLTLTNCTMTGNNASSGGGGIFNGWGTLTMTNCTVTGNTTSRDGGGIYNDCGTLTLTNCTVTGNAASSGGGIYNYETLTLTNSIVTMNYGDISGSLTDSSYNLIGDDPCFVVAPEFDENGNLTNLDSIDLHLMKTSTCIDTGSNDAVTVETDLDGNPRIVNGIVDLGAYEYQDGGESTPLAAPTISAVASAGANRHSITWDAVENAVGYELTYSTDQEAWSRTLSTTDTSFVMTGLTYGTQVYYKVKAVGDGASWSDSDWSEAKSLYVCPMDSNGDKIVSGADLTLLSKAWFARPTSANWDARADVDGSNMVNGSDLTWLSSNWLKRPTSAGLTYPAEKAQIFADADFDAIDVDCDFALETDVDVFTDVF